MPPFVWRQILLFLLLCGCCARRLGETSRGSALRRLEDNGDPDQQDDAYFEEAGDDFYDGDDGDVDDDRNNGDDEGDWQEPEYDDDDNDDKTRLQQYEANAVESATSMFNTAPSEWSATQWGLFSACMTMFGICFFCWCIACLVPRCCGQKGTMMYSAMLS